MGWLVISPVSTILKEYPSFYEALEAAIYIHTSLKKVGYEGEDTICLIKKRVPDKLKKYHESKLDELNLQLKGTMMHPSTEAILRYFDYEHLPPHLQEISKHFHWLAYALVGQAPTHANSTHEQFHLDGPELTMALRKLLEAKDCAVRAAL